MRGHWSSTCGFGSREDLDASVTFQKGDVQGSCERPQLSSRPALLLHRRGSAWVPSSQGSEEGRARSLGVLVCPPNTSSSASDLPGALWVSCSARVGVVSHTAPCACSSWLWPLPRPSPLSIPHLGWGARILPVPCAPTLQPGLGRVPPSATPSGGPQQIGDSHLGHIRHPWGLCTPGLPLEGSAQRPRCEGMLMLLGQRPHVGSNCPQ